MASGRTTFAKLQRERAKKAKAEEKRARRLEGGDARPEPEAAEQEPDDLLSAVAELVGQHQAGLITEEELLSKRAELLEKHG